MLSSGKRLHPAVGDLNADGFPDVILGNMSGGLHYFEGKAFNSINVEEEARTAEFKIVPNPSSSVVRFESTHNGAQAVLYDLMGKELGNYPVNEHITLALPKGMYIVKLRDSMNRMLATEKLVLH